MVTRNFALRDKDGTEHGVFTGRQPRQAALKVANRGNGTKDKPEIFMLRERGTQNIHMYEGWNEKVPAPKNKPSWMPDTVKKPNVKKLKTERLIDKI